MSRNGWFSFLGRKRRAAEALARFTRAAAAGEPLSHLLQLAATGIRACAQADRVGVWLNGDAPQRLEGVVVQGDPAAVPQEWNRLDISASAWKKILQSATPVLWDLRVRPSTSAAFDAGLALSGPLADMERAAWWPVRFCGWSLGVALVAFRTGRSRMPESTGRSLRAFADQLAMCAAAHRSRREVERANGAHELHEGGERGHRQEVHAEAELRALLETVENGVLLFDNEGRIRHANERFAQLFGLDVRQVRSPGTATGSPATLEQLHEMLQGRVGDPESITGRWCDLRVRGDIPATDEIQLLRPTHRRIERFTRPVLDAQGKCEGWLEVYREHDSARLLDDKLLQTEKMVALGQLVSGIAHELNNPLTSIMGYAQLLLARGPGAEAFREIQRDAERIYREAERAGRIVKNLLLFSRERHVERCAVNLNEIVERTLALRSYELKVENIQVELLLDPALPRTLADAHQLQQVVLNLLLNAEQAILHGSSEPAAADGQAEAVKNSGQGRIRIRTSVLAGAQPVRLLLEFSDNGPGIPAHLTSRVFDPFFTTKPVGLGTGLGLSIAYGIVHAHGGEIYLDAGRSGGGGISSRGATFVVEIPVHAIHEAAAPLPAGVQVERRALPRTVTASRRSPGIRVLVVEDEPTVAQLIADVLGECGYRVDIVLDSLEGLARTRQVDYDLVICDLRMPRLDGRAFYHALVRVGHPAQHRLVFVTGDTLSSHTLEFLGTTGLPYLSKPFLVEELKDVVHRALLSADAPDKRRLADSPLASPVKALRRVASQSGAAELALRKKADGMRKR